MMIIGFLAIGFLVYYLMNGNNNVNLAGKGKSHAEEILERRFVTGEIDENTFLQMKETLK